MWDRKIHNKNASKWLLTCRQLTRCNSISPGSCLSLVKCSPNCIELFYQSISYAGIHGIQTSRGYRTEDGSFSVLRVLFLHHQQYWKCVLISGILFLFWRLNKIAIQFIYRPASRGGRMLEKNTFLMAPVGVFTLIASPLNISVTVPIKSFSFPVKFWAFDW